MIPRALPCLLLALAVFALAACEQEPDVDTDRDGWDDAREALVELTSPVDMRRVQPLFVEQGVWVRPFGRLVYLMPPLVIDDDDLSALTTAVSRVVAGLQVADGVCVPLD